MPVLRPTGVCQAFWFLQGFFGAGSNEGSLNSGYCRAYTKMGLNSGFGTIVTRPALEVSKISGRSSFRVLICVILSFWVHTRCSDLWKVPCRNPCRPFSMVLWTLRISVWKAHCRLLFSLGVRGHGVPSPDTTVTLDIHWPLRPHVLRLLDLKTLNNRVLGP